MTMTIDLYQLYGFDRTDASEEIALLLSGRDAELGNRGVLPDNPQRSQLQTAYSVFRSESTRSVYDEALSSGRPLGWQDLEYLGNFGSLPEPPSYPGTAGPGRQQSMPFAPPVDTAQQTPFQQSTPGHATPFYSAPTSPPPAYPQYAAPGNYGQPGAEDRPSAGLRLGMMLLDSLAAGVLGTIGGMLFFFSDTLAALTIPLIGLAYFIGFEVYTGATPVKHLFGYKVRDAATGENLSIEQSAKRNWWRIVNLVPFIGTLVAFVGMIVIGTSINPANGNVGVHDRWAGAEVVRK